MQRRGPSLLLTATLLALAAALPAALAEDKEPGEPGVACGPAIAEVLSPSDGAEVPRQGVDPPCEKSGYCISVNVEGRIGNCYWPFIGVMPRETKPLFWIQPPVRDVDRSTGRFSLEVHLGSGRDGLDEEFEIFVIGHRQQSRFYEEETFFGLPDECRAAAAKDGTAPCIASAVVTVRRVR